MPIEIQQLSHAFRDQAAQEAYLDSLRDDTISFDAQNRPVVPIEDTAAFTDHIAQTDAPNIGDLALQGLAKVTQCSTHAVDAFRDRINTLPPNPSIGDCINTQWQIMNFGLAHDTISKVAGMSANAISTLFRNQ